MRRNYLAACAAGALLCMSGAAIAQAPFPSKPLRLVVPFSAGGGNDSVARVLADAMAKVLGQPMIVDNRAGAGGNIGTDHVAKATPDGYTILHVANTVVVNPSLYKKLPYDVEKDLVPLGLAATSPIRVLAHPSAGINTLPELVDAMKKRGGKLSYATPGVGTPHHFAMELLASKLSSDVVHIAYKGAGPAVIDAVSGQVPLLLSTPQSVNDFIANGRLRLIASMESRRSEQLKNVPAVAEAVPGFSVSIWHGLMAPAGTPKPVLDKLTGALQKVLAQADVQARLQTIGFQAAYQPPAAMAKRIQEEIPTWQKVAEAARIVPE